MAKGISLHIGINRVNPVHYSGWWKPLHAAENDARAMYEIAASENFDCALLLGQDASRGNVSEGIARAAERLETGDLFLITFSGHGGQKVDLYGFEDDRMNETWCLYDGQMIDDELYLLWKRFASGVRIVMFSDSCNSGTVAKMAEFSVSGSDHVKALPDWVAAKVAQDNEHFYKGVREAIVHQKQAFAGNGENFSGLLISACRDGRKAYDGPIYSLFTEALLHVWDGGNFEGGYRDFFRGISDRLYRQKPNYYLFGKGKFHFDPIRPFQI